MTPKEKYTVIRKLDAGGMAEVFLGQAEGIEGFQKRVAIKRVLPHLVENKKFLAMFLDEARLGLRMNHANVVHVFDIGRSGKTYFIVMEYVDGTNLKRLMDTMRAQGKRIPLELAVYVILEICRGLAYAHALRDQKGQPIGIVHRDVSPPNILLSRQGEVKIVDFGLAKATSQLEHTDPGVVKGKFAYLSPEAAFGRPVDHRADIFACGILLFELLTGERLFLGANDVRTIEIVRAAEVPMLSEFDVDVPSNLERIMRRALSPTADSRFPNCNEFGEALAGFLFEHGLKVTSFDLQRLVNQVADEVDQEDAVSPSIIDRLIEEELGHFASLEDKRGSDSGQKVTDSTGAHPLDPSGFSPAGLWVDNQEESPIDLPVRRDQSSGVWRESGLADVNQDSPAKLMFIPSRPPTPTPAEPVKDNTDSLARMLEGETRLQRSPVQVDNSMVQGQFLLIAIGVTTALIIGGLLMAYFLDWIP